MSATYKGIAEVYDDVCHELDDMPFVDWIRPGSGELVPGQICSTVVWYVKYRCWYLEPADYDSMDEDKSTWRLRELRGDLPPMVEGSVMKRFELEKDEGLITTNCKVRPVILLRYSRWDWLNPRNEARHVNSWLCIPLYSYKERHNQDYVLRDQKLLSQDRFYIPPGDGRRAGPINESAASYQNLQTVNAENLKALTCDCLVGEPKMRRPFRLSKLGLRLVLYHLYRNLGVFAELNDPGSEYDLFKEYVGRIIDAAV